MALGSIRPRFRMNVPGTVEVSIAQVESAVARPESRCVSRGCGNHLDITVIREDRHRWSPCLQLEFRASDEGTSIEGLVGPHPNTWTLYAFVVFNVVIATGFALMLGLAQLALERVAWGLWVVPGGLLLLGAMYVVSQVGRRLAAEQTRALTALVEAALGTTAI